MGGGQPFIAHTADEPITVKVEVPADAKQVRLFNGARLLADKPERAGEFVIRLPAGVHPLYVIVETGMGTLSSRPHTLIVRRK